MNKRQIKKKEKQKYIQQMAELEKELSICQECGNKLDIKNTYHMTQGLCNTNCFLNFIGMSWTDFYKVK